MAGAAGPAAPFVASDVSLAGWSRSSATGGVVAGTG